jgi:hypothetical protein
MKEIVGKRGLIFKTNSRKEDIARVRHEVYYDLFEECRNPSIIAKFLMDEYGYKVSRSTIYHGWYSIKSMNNMLDSHKFARKYRGKMSVEDMLDRYLMDHLQMLLDARYKNRRDLSRKVNELIRRNENIRKYESMGRD